MIDGRTFIRSLGPAQTKALSFRSEILNTTKTARPVAVPVICSGGTLNVTTKASPITTPGTM